MKDNYSKTWQIGHSFLICHFLTGLGKNPITLCAFQIVEFAIDLFGHSLNLLPQTQVFDF